MSKKIVVLGAGYAGILIAKKLTKKLKNQDIEITIIDKNSFHTMLTELHEVAAWRVDEESIRIDIKKVFAGRKVNVVLDNIISTDYDKQVISGQNGTYEYDYLVFATGCKPCFFGVKGVKEHGFTLWSYDDAVRLREHIMNMFRKASVEPNLEIKKSLLNFYIIGSGFTGVEMAGELAELTPVLCKKFNIEPSLVTIHNLDVADKVVPILPDKVANKALRRLQKMKVNVMLKTNVVGVNKDSIEYVVPDGKKFIKEGNMEYAVDGNKIVDSTHTVIWAAGTEGSDIVSSSENLGLVKNARGRVQTDKYLRSQSYPNVYIGGDNIFYIPEGEERPVPQMVENCEACAKTISNNIASEVLNTNSLQEYRPKFHGVMVCIGGRYGVAHVGGHNKKLALPSFFAMLSKHLINMVYLFQVLGWNKVFSYSMHEFFTIRNKRSFVGGHFSNRTPSFLLFPLRICLGFFWIFEGYKKLVDDWLDTPKLEGFFGGANAWWDSILYGDASIVATSAATDAVAEATSAATTSASTGGYDPVILNLNFFDQIGILLVSAGELAIKIQVSLSDWFIDKFVLSTDATQIFFQNVVVFSEILIGIALIVGLFTTIASAYSLLLLIMFITSTGLYMSDWWMIAAAIALLFGGGKTLGLDYYVLPKLKEGWKKIGFVKKWYIYND